MADHEPLIEPQVVSLTRWADIVEYLENFPPPRVGLDEYGDVRNTAWIFRGVSDAKFKLEPGIERSAGNAHMGSAALDMGWAALEEKVSEEFKYRAHVYLDRPLATDDELTWLALMQHYGIPTRLLDFTLSPFVALHFAARYYEGKRNCARVWAMDSEAIDRQCREVVTRARAAERQRRGERRGGRVSLRPDDAASDRDVLKSEALAKRRRAEDVLAATGTFRSELKRRGCVCVALPPSFNPRLANQQGLFLFNGAEDLPFETSLAKMMKGQANWCIALDFPVALLAEIEMRLFQMNIHEQSLFPDLHGLAGLIRQRIRLHWK